ncbi:unnamed protein product, partial [Ascophyllum nodosum]
IGFEVRCSEGIDYGPLERFVSSCTRESVGYAWITGTRIRAKSLWRESLEIWLEERKETSRVNKGGSGSEPPSLTTSTCNRNVIGRRNIPGTILGRLTNEGKPDRDESLCASAFGCNAHDGDRGRRHRSRVCCGSS